MSRSTSRAAVVFASATLWLACSGPIDTISACEQDSHCGSGQVCLANRCVIAADGGNLSDLDVGRRDSEGDSGGPLGDVIDDGAGVDLDLDRDADDGRDAAPDAIRDGDMPLDGPVDRADESDARHDGDAIMDVDADGEPILPSCGNGVVERGEDCDDGNTDDDLLCPGDCILPLLDLCWACTDDDDCGRAADRCLDLGDDGRTCGIDCSESGDCPDGFACEVVAGGPDQCAPVGTPVDERPLVNHYPDRDGDRFGDGTAEPLIACVELPGYAPNTSDCDDDPMQCGVDCGPGVDEVCDGWDNDCDDVVDDGDGVCCGNDLVESGETCDGDDLGELVSDSCADYDPIAYRDGQVACLASCQDYDLGACVPADSITCYSDEDADGATGTPQLILDTQSCDDFDTEGRTWTDLYGGDCNDDPVADPACAAVSRPGQTEICDGCDNDCDEDFDDADQDLRDNPDTATTGASPFHRDNDGDMCGRAGSQPAYFCSDSPPEGFADNALDPDDFDGQCCGNASAEGDETCDGADLGALGSSACTAFDPIIYVGGTLSCAFGCLNYDLTSCVPAAERTCYSDEDGDGVTGTPQVVLETQTCADFDTGGRPWSAVDGGDCDDDPFGCGSACAPGATEVCDDFDNDCDEDVDDADDDLRANPDTDTTDAAAYYVDADADSCGASGSGAVYLCVDAPPEGFADNDYDDDDDDGICCGNDLVEDLEVCDGSDFGAVGSSLCTDFDPIAYRDGQLGCLETCDDYDVGACVPAGTLTCYSDEDGDGVTGTPQIIPDTTNCSDYDTDGRAWQAATGGDCTDDPMADPLCAAVSYPGATEICDGCDNDCDGETDVDDLDLTTNPDTETTGAHIYWVDNDLDDCGWAGDAPTYLCGRRPPDGFSDNDLDADDGDGICCGNGLVEAAEACDGGEFAGQGSNLCTDLDGIQYVGGVLGCDAACGVLTGGCVPAVEITCYSDEDGDGATGTPQIILETQSCPNFDTSGRPWTSVDGGDCLDDPGAPCATSSYPGNTEVCDGCDNDCDDQLDDDDEGVVYGPEHEWYLDADEDGFGDAGATQLACTQPSGYLPGAGDCNDANPYEAPSGREVIGDEVDQDCDTRELCWLDADGDGQWPSLEPDGPQVIVYDSTLGGGPAPPSDDGVWGEALVRLGVNGQVRSELADFLALDPTDGAIPLVVVHHISGPLEPEVRSVVSDRLDAELPVILSQVDWSGDPSTVALLGGISAGGELTGCALVPSAVGPVDIGGLTSAVPDPHPLSDGNCRVLDGYAEALGHASVDPFGPILVTARDGMVLLQGFQPDDGSDTDGDGVDDEVELAGNEVAFMLNRWSGWNALGYVVESITTTCEQPGLVAIDATGDCDDDSLACGAACSGSGLEICDGWDNDCDGAVDDADDDVRDNPDTATTGAIGYYRDQDLDGCGDGAVIAYFCSAAPPVGWADNSLDVEDDDGVCCGNGQAESGEACDGLDLGGLGSNLCAAYDIIYESGVITCDGGCDLDFTDCDLADETTCYSDEDGDGATGTPQTILETQSCSDFDTDGRPWTETDDGDCNDDPLDACATLEHPGADEVCDGCDNDCDGPIDDADASLDTSTATTFYDDADGDGHGDPDADLLACDPPPDTATAGDDCNDDAGDACAPLSWDDAGETCDGCDNDCDGALDEADPDIDPAELTAYYPDDDGDGFGETAAGGDYCNQPAGHVLTEGDCDDTRRAVFPGALEVPGDERDQDCDGDEICYVDGDGDGYWLSRSATSLRVLVLSESGGAPEVAEAADAYGFGRVEQTTDQQTFAQRYGEDDWDLLLVQLAPGSFMGSAVGNALDEHINVDGRLAIVHYPLLPADPDAATVLGVDPPAVHGGQLVAAAPTGPVDLFELAASVSGSPPLADGYFDDVLSDQWVLAVGSSNGQPTLLGARNGAVIVGALDTSGDEGARRALWTNEIAYALAQFTSGGLANGLMTVVEGIVCLPSARPAADFGDCNDGQAGVGPEATDVPELGFQDTNCDGVDGDATQAYFVSPFGSDGERGTRFLPLATLGHAIERAEGDPSRPLVFVGGEATGTFYDEFVTLPDGVSLIGSYDAADWGRSTDIVTGIRPSGELVALFVDGYGGIGAIQGLHIVADDADSIFLVEVGGSTYRYGHSSRALVLDGVTGTLLINGNTFQAGSGASAVAGVTGSTGTSGGDGGDGGDGQSGTGGSRGSAGVSVCAPSDRGGRGGGPLEDGEDAADVFPGPAQGGDGGSVDTNPCASNVTDGDAGTGGAITGSDGSAGNRPADQNDGALWTTVLPDGTVGLYEWSANRGEDGSQGSHGRAGAGGGGGGACVRLNPLAHATGGGGGGGGGGGCGGSGGQAGAGGGGSIGVLVIDSPGVTLRDNLFVTDQGGDGGDGGDGGSGGLAGMGGQGGSGRVVGSSVVGGDGGSGGHGRSGRRGGGGSGGAGGMSVGILISGSVPSVTNNVYTLGQAGDGGAGGAFGSSGSGEDGENGLRTNVFDLD